MSKKYIIGSKYSLSTKDSKENLTVKLVAVKGNVLTFDHSDYDISVDVTSGAVDFVSKEKVATEKDNDAFSLSLATSLLKQLQEGSGSTKTLQQNLEKYIKKMESVLNEENKDV